MTKKYKEAAQNYLNKNLDNLREAEPGKVFSILKRLGAKPGEGTDGGTFSLPVHENLSDEQSAERIAEHFAAISQEFPPLNPQQLPQRVKVKLQSHTLPPTVSEFDVFQKMKAAKKPRSGVPNDLPKLLTQEFLPELATPVSRIINSMLVSGEWPSQWKLEQVVPVQKVPMPETEDDLRPISLTPFFSKVTEQIDFRQYGGIKGSSICHYISLSLSISYSFIKIAKTRQLS